MTASALDRWKAVLPKETADPAILAYFTRLRDDYSFFVTEVFREMNLDRVAPLGPVELDMVRFAGDPSRRLRGVLAFRGIGKTYMITCTLAAHRLFMDPDRKVVLPSKSGAAAIDNVGLVRTWIDTCWFLNWLRPRKSQRDTERRFTVGPAQPQRQDSLVAIGIDGQMENLRAHTVIPDDVETKGNTGTHEAREGLAVKCAEFVNWLYPENQFTRDCPTEIVYVGTPKHENTLYVKLRDNGFVFQSYPIQYPGSETRVISMAPLLQAHLKTGRAQPGDPVVPERFPPREVALKRSSGETEFLKEFMLVADLATTNRYPLKLRDFLVMEIDRDRAPVYLVWGTQNGAAPTRITDIPTHGFDGDHLHTPVSTDKDYAPYQGVKAGIDPAGTGEDDLGIAIGGMLAGFIHISCVESFQNGTSPDTMHALAALLRRHNCREVYPESNWGGGMWNTIFAPVLQSYSLKPGQNPAFPNGWSCDIVVNKRVTHGHGAVPGSGNKPNQHSFKDNRIIDTILPALEAHRLVIDRRVITDPTLQQALTHIRREKDSLRAHRLQYGRLDALRILIRAWQFSLAVDPVRQADRARIRSGADFLKKALADQRRRLGVTVAGPPARPRWFKHRRGR